MIPQIKTITNIRNPFLLVMDLKEKDNNEDNDGDNDKNNRTNLFSSLSIRNKISEKMYGIRRYFIGVNNKKDNYFCYSL